MTQNNLNGLVAYITKNTNTINVNMNNESDRLNKFTWRKKMLEDNFYQQVQEEMGNVVVSADETGLIKQIDDTNNIFKMVVCEISKVYSKAPIRDFGDNNQEEMAELYKKLKINDLLKQSNKYINAFNDCLIHVGLVDSEFVLRLRTPDQTIVISDEWDRMVEVYVYVDNVDDQEIWYGYTASEMFKVVVSTANDVTEADRLPIENEGDTSNKLGFIPFIPIHDGFRDGMFWQKYSKDDLVKGNIQISMALTFLNHLIKMQSFKQMVAKSENGGGLDNLTGVEIDPASIIFANGAEISLLDLESNYKMLWDVIKEKITVIATNYKISPNLFNMTQSPSSGFSLLMQNIKLDDFIEDQKEIYTNTEQELFDMLKKMNDIMNLNIIKGDEFSIEFKNAKYPQTKKEILEEEQIEIDLGKTNMIEIIANERGVDEAEAILIYNNNIAKRNEGNQRVQTPIIETNIEA